MQWRWLAAVTNVVYGAGSRHSPRLKWESRKRSGFAASYRRVITARCGTGAARRSLDATGCARDVCKQSVARTTGCLRGNPSRCSWRVGCDSLGSAASRATIRGMQKAIPPAINEKWFMTHILPNAWTRHALYSDPIYQQSTAEIEALRASRSSLLSLLRLHSFKHPNLRLKPASRATSDPCYQASPAQDAVTL